MQYERILHVELPTVILANTTGNKKIWIASVWHTSDLLTSVATKIKMRDATTSTFGSV